MILKKIDRLKLYAPPWMIIGVSLVLMIVVAVLAVLNYNREKNYMGKILAEKGAALIRSFEAGARTGMMGMFGSDAHLQTLLQETASQPDISYIALVDKTGTILAHNNKQNIGEIFKGFEFNQSSEPSDESKWRIIESPNGTTYFEVYKKFLPVLDNLWQNRRAGMMRRMRGQGRNNMWCAPGWMDGMPAQKILDPEHRPAIFIGMDVKPFEAAMAEDIRFSIITALIIFLLGIAGVVSLFWAQNYTRSRKLLQDTKAFASEIVTNLPVGIVVVNTESLILYINDVASFLLNIPRTKTINQNAKGILPENLLEVHKHTSGSRKLVVEREMQLSTTESKTVPVAVTATDIMDDNGHFIGDMFILKDLSEIRELEIKIKRREKLVAIGNLAAGVAHEVRNPLSSIKGYATYFASLFEEGSENRNASNLMAEEVDRINRVISELLEFAKPSDLKVKKTDLAQLLDDSIRLVTLDAEAAGVNILKDIEEGLPNIMMDPDRFSQVLLNLFINSIQSFKNGGQVSIRVGRSATTNHIIIKISDTGDGISVENQEDIFNPYFTTKKNGTGLGLAIVHKIVESHGGSIHVNSREGSGTLFTISLPLKMEDVRR